MAFQFSDAKEFNKDVAAKLFSKGKVDPAEQLKIVNECLGGVPEARMANVTSVTEANEVAAEFLDAYLGTLSTTDNQGSNNPANNADNVPTTVTNDESLSIPTGETNTQAMQMIKQSFQTMQNNAAKSYIKDIITIAPKPLDRLTEETKDAEGKVVRVPKMMTINENEADKLKDWQEKGFVPTDDKSKEAFEKALEAATKGDPVAVYVNDKARPVIGGYIIHDGTREKGKEDYPVPRKGYTLLGRLARLYGTRLEPDSTNTVIGAYISKRKKQNGKEVRGRKRFIIRFVGINDYFGNKEHPNGIQAWTYDKKTKDFNVKSDIKFTLYKPVKDNKNQPDVKNTRTVRLSGKLNLPLLAPTDQLTQDMIDVGIKVNTGESQIGSNTMPAVNNEEAMQTSADVIATMATMAKNSDDVIKGGKGDEEAQVILNLLKDNANSGANVPGEEADALFTPKAEDKK